MTNFRRFQIERVCRRQLLADDKLRFDENGSKFSKKVENTLGKGEIACYLQFLPFQQCFQETCIADT